VQLGFVEKRDRKFVAAGHVLGEISEGRGTRGGWVGFESSGSVLKSGNGGGRSRGRRPGEGSGALSLLMEQVM
jgi:hypothetical protein